MFRRSGNVRDLLVEVQKWRKNMTNEEAIEWLEAIRKKYIHGGDEGFDQKRNEALDLAISALSRDRWISVEERLPTVGDKVIVAIRDESGDTRYDYTNEGWYSGDGYKWVVDDEFCSWVTHWRPLPEPPKEET